MSTQPQSHFHTHAFAPNPASSAPRFGKPKRAFGDPVAAPKPYPHFEPLPVNNALNLNLPLEVVVPDATAAAQADGQLVFHSVGDTGGIHGEDVQKAIADAMESQIEGSDGGAKPAFLYNLGDVVYFNGQSTQYKWQFYEPYQDYHAPIFAIPGNHDGDTRVRRGDTPDTEPSLFGFMQNFCDSAPHADYPYRDTMTQPYAYWTLDAPFVTIVGLYSNVEGTLDARGTNEQQRWLEDQFRNAPKDKALLVAVHHPPYSLDASHGGSPDILYALDRAMDQSGRIPTAVLSGHVHDYQRFSRVIKKKRVPFIVAGAGGYANTSRLIHKLQHRSKDSLIEVPFKTTEQDVRLENYNEEMPGFLRVTVNPKKEIVTFEYFTLSFEGQLDPKPFDTVAANW